MEKENKKRLNQENWEGKDGLRFQLQQIKPSEELIDFGAFIEVHGFSRHIEGVSFHQFNFNDFSLMHLEFYECNFAGCNFRNTSLSHSQLTECNFKKTKWFDTTWNDVSLNA